MINLLKKRIEISLKASGKKGFTLVELLVTIVIFVTLTSVVLFSQGNFDNSVLLNNLAYDTALTVRQAQTYGVNVRESTIGEFSSYGVFFDIGAGGNDKNFVLYADTIPDKTLTGGSVILCPVDDPECLQKYSITRGSYIQSFCVGSSADSCDPLITKLNILFERPNPDAIIYADDNPIPNNYAKIIISSADGQATKNIIITSVGQIYVEK